MMLKRARQLSMSGEKLFATPSLTWFLERGPDHPGLLDEELFLDHFNQLDDTDILASAKVWCHHSDKVLAMLAGGLVNRELFSVELDDEPFTGERLKVLSRKASEQLHLSREETTYLVVSDSVSNYAYSDLDDRISIVDKKGEIRDIADASDMLNISVLSKTIRKYFLCYPRILKRETGTMLNQNDASI
jgi:hypothetical protein